MKIKIQQFLFGKLHSWSICGQNIGHSLLKLNNNVDFISTDGLQEKYIPSDLKPYIKLNSNEQYDMAVTYTAPHNFATYTSNSKIKFGIWNYEYRGTRILPGMAKNSNCVDRVLPSSNFSKQVFLDMGIPEKKLTIVPHGIDLEQFKTKNIYPLKTKRKYKILLNIASPHKRKAIDLALKVYGEAFKKDKDDVCLVIKVHTDNKKEVNKKNIFDINFYELYSDFCKNYPNRADVEIITDYIFNIAELYNACDIHFSTTFAECFFFPALESLATDKPLINVIPRYGGQLDFCNDNNSLLIDGKIVRAPKDHQYWNYSPYAQHFQVDVDDAVKKLQLSVKNHVELYKNFYYNMKQSAQIYTWDNATQQILNLANE